MASLPWPVTSTSRRPPREKHGRSRIVIPLPTAPREYVPGSGPKLEPVRLLPPRDSTAYILDRILLASPGPAADGRPLPKRMAYLIGWHDLPAARMFVPAMQVLDYVSPYALEEWEWQMELEQDEERAKLEEEAAQELPKPKKRGRPPAHTLIEAAVVAEPELEGAATGWSAKGVMSITTTTKPRPIDFDDHPDEVSPSRQLERELLEGAMDVDLDESSKEVDMVDGDEDPDSRQSEIFSNSLDPMEREGSFSEGKKSRNIAMAWQPESLPSTVITSSTSSARSTPKPSIPVKSVGRKRKTPATKSLLRKTLGSKPAPNVPNVAPGSSSLAPVADQPTAPVCGRETPVPLPKIPLEYFTSKSVAKKSSQPPPKKIKAKIAATETAQPPSEEAIEPVWEVQRLEDMELYEVEGRGLVRYFKVRWEGDWPPEQNPSWEPEDNLPAKLVRNYLKRGKKKAPPLARKKAAMKQTTLSWANGKKYRSVSDAFEGDADDFEMGGGGVDQTTAVANKEEEDDVEFFVIAEEEQPRPRASWTAANGSAAGMGLGPLAMH